MSTLLIHRYKTFGAIHFTVPCIFLAFSPSPGYYYKVTLKHKGFPSSGSQPEWNFSNILHFIERHKYSSIETFKFNLLLRNLFSCDLMFEIEILLVSLNCAIDTYTFLYKTSIQIFFKKSYLKEYLSY